MEGGPPLAAWRGARVLLAVTAAGIPLSTTVMQAGVIGLAVLSAAAFVARWRIVRATPLDGALGVLGLVLLLSTLASGHPTEAVGWVRPWVVVTYFVVFWWLEDAAHARRLVRVLLIAGSVAAAYGILQHFTGVDWYRERARSGARGGATRTRRQLLRRGGLLQELPHLRPCDDVPARLRAGGERSAGSSWRSGPRD